MYSDNVGAGCSSMVEHSIMMQCIIVSIQHGRPTKLFIVSASVPHGMYYPVCRIVHIKEPLLLIGKSNPCSGTSRFPHAISVVFYNMSDTI